MKSSLKTIIKLCTAEMMELRFSSCLNFILLLATLITVATQPLCPDGCGCSGGFPATSFNVNCYNSVEVKQEQLTEQLDSLLSSNLTYGHVRSLTIRNTLLANVPRSVCRLTTLTDLHLDYNRLTRLPDNCFSNLTALTSFSASFNSITDLQDGLFDGLSKLVSIHITNNRISSIGLRLFNSSAMLSSLKIVDLSNNRIRTLEPWFYYVGVNGRGDDRASVNLCFNNISSFTNMMGWEATCGKRKVVINLNLCRNAIKHISDMSRGWNISLLTWLCLSPHRSGMLNTHVLFDRNHFECDCADFDIYKLVFPPLLGHVDYFSRSYCSGPDSLFGRKILTVPLDEFVCELTEHCPPGCRCVHRPANATLHIYCSNKNLTALPLELPEIPKSYTKYKLDFSSNRGIHHLEHRDYLVNTSILDVRNCNLESVDFNMWKYLANISLVFLDGNRLQSLPSSVAAVHLKTASLSLGRNPWKCSCDASWMSLWLQSVRESLTNPSEITCATPSRLRNRGIISISTRAFCVDPTSEAVKKSLTVSLSSATGVALILLSVCVIACLLRIKLYTKWKFHPFDRDECLGENMDYDVFLCCSSEDHDPEGRRIVETMEDNGYRVCYHYRDFRPGLIMDNIEASVTRSKRTVCLLTTHFIHRFASPSDFNT